MIRTVMGVDCSMNNTGWSFQRFQIENPLRNAETPPIPEWILKKDVTGEHNYHHFEKIAGGCICPPDNQGKLPWVVKINSIVPQLHRIVHQYKPDILSVEYQLDKGKSKSPTGMAVFNAIVNPYYPEALKYFHPRVSKESNSPEHVPPFLVFIRPEGLQSIAHYERSTNGTTVVRRYRSVSGDKRVTEHEADAFFLAYHATRFWGTHLQSVWDKSILTEKEKYWIDLSATSMLKRTHEAWWENTKINLG